VSSLQHCLGRINKKLTSQASAFGIAGTDCYITAFMVNRKTLDAATESGSTNTSIEITIWTHRRDFTSDPVRIYLDWNPNLGSPSIRRIARS
jgi:hypothetical protein